MSQKGAKRAAYGTQLLKDLSARLTEEFERGFSGRISNTCGSSSSNGRAASRFPSRLLGNWHHSQLVSPVLPEENPTIGLLLCKSAKKTVVELTLPKDANIHAKDYQLYLPSKELLKQKLDEWSAADSTARPRPHPPKPNGPPYHSEGLTRVSRAQPWYHAANPTPCRRTPTGFRTFTEGPPRPHRLHRLHRENATLGPPSLHLAGQ
jgi:hypothetical protein